jgi:hypothetical protein
MLDFRSFQGGGGAQAYLFRYLLKFTDFSQDYSWVGKMFPIFVLLTAHFRFQDYEYVSFQPLALLPH